MPGTVTIHRTRYLEDDVYDGSLPHGAYEDTGTVPGTSTDTHDGLAAREACELIRREGLTFEATGGQWAANPDGSYVSDYGTGERCEVSAHLSRTRLTPDSSRAASWPHYLRNRSPGAPA